MAWGNIGSIMSAGGQALGAGAATAARSGMLQRVIGALAQGAAVYGSNNPGQALQQQLMQAAEEKRLIEERKIRQQEIEGSKEHDIGMQTREFRFRETADSRAAEHQAKVEKLKAAAKFEQKTLELEAKAEESAAKFERDLELEQFKAQLGAARTSARISQEEGARRRIAAEDYAREAAGRLTGRGVDPTAAASIAEKLATNNASTLNASESAILNAVSQLERQGGTGNAMISFLNADQVEYMRDDEGNILTDHNDKPIEYSLTLDDKMKRAEGLFGTKPADELYKMLSGDSEAESPHETDPPPVPERIQLLAGKLREAKDMGVELDDLLRQIQAIPDIPFVKLTLEEAAYKMYGQERPKAEESRRALRRLP